MPAKRTAAKSRARKSPATKRPQSTNPPPLRLEWRSPAELAENPELLTN